MRQDKSVGIALATYNGGKYIGKQLKSIADQSYDNIVVFIRDDGSSDDTVEVVRRFIAEYSGPKRFVLMESSGNLGVPGSFYKILTTCEACDYYGFCDQDDVWYSDKVKWAVEMLEGSDARPTIYYSRCDYCDDAGNVLRVSAQQDEALRLDKVIYHSPASGFTCVFNDALRRLMIVDHDPGTELHDRYFIRGAACFGRAVYDDRRSAAHIRHSEAVTAGDSGNRALLRQFLLNELAGDSAKKEKQWLQHFYRSFCDKLSPRDRETLRLFASDEKGVVLWLKKVFYPHRLRERVPGEIALRLLFVLGRI